MRGGEAQREDCALNLVNRFQFLRFLLEDHVPVRVVQKLGASPQPTVTSIDIRGPAYGVSKLIDCETQGDHSFMELLGTRCGAVHRATLGLRWMASFKPAWGL